MRIRSEAKSRLPWATPAPWSFVVAMTSLATLIILTSAVIAKADPNPHRWENWKTDFETHSINLSEVQSGGPAKDGIPSIDKPKFIPVADEDGFFGPEPVIGLEFEGEARAYPLSILMWHEIVNDTINGKPVLVTYCPLCNAALVFDASVDGKPHAFGTTGRLRNSDLLMYDRVTESWWQQFTGEAVIGEYTGKKLQIIPSRLESFDRFKSRFPDGMVLVPNNENLRDYGRNPYTGYDTLDKPFLYSGPLPDGIPAMERVVIARTGDDDNPVILRMPALVEAGELEINGITFSWSPGQNSALDAPRISAGRDVGNVTVTRKSSDDKPQDVAYDVTFAFVAHAFHPETPIRGK